jgi:hypothetical protein
VLVDLSRTGARLTAVTLPSKGQELIFRAEKINIPAELIWARNEHCAVEFDTPIAADEVKRIRALANFTANQSGTSRA